LGASPQKGALGGERRYQKNQKKTKKNLLGEEGEKKGNHTETGTTEKGERLIQKITETSNIGGTGKKTSDSTEEPTSP